MRNLEKYFEEARNMYLVSIDYRLNEDLEEELPEEITMDCEDSITAEVYAGEGMARIIFSRGLSFSPFGPYELDVSFGMDMIISPEYKDAVDWDHINLAEEIMQHGDGMIDDVISRVSLLIAQITSSYGQSPLFTPSSLEEA